MGPDLMKVAFWECETASDFEVEVAGAKGDKYIVSFGPVCGRGVQNDWSCTCAAFRFGKGKECKHIQAAKAKYCGWMQFMDGGEVARDAKGDPVCPKCGKEAKPRMWGV